MAPPFRGEAKPGFPLRYNKQSVETRNSDFQVVAGAYLRIRKIRE